jgi:copper(I)-binding protein
VIVRAATAAILAAAVCAGCGESRPIVAEAGHIAIADAYATASAAPDMSSVYFTVRNRGAVADTLLAVQSTGTAELHTMVTQNGLSSMVPVTALPVLGGTCVMLKPGGHHVMLRGLPTPLAEGDSIDVSVSMARAGTIAFRIPVLTYTGVVERLDAARGDCP